MFEEYFQKKEPLSDEQIAALLSERQLRVIESFANGDTVPGISTEIGYAVDTIKDDCRRIYEVLEVNTQAGAVGKALRMGLVA